MKRILVTGAGGSAAFNFVDSLRIAKEKFYIVGVDTRPYHLELTQVDKKYLIPRVDESNYLVELNKIIRKEKIDLVHPQPDIEVGFISKNRDKLEAKTFLPSPLAIERCQNKASLIKILEKEKIKTGESYLVENEKNLKRIIKKMRSNHEKIWIRVIRGAGSKGSLPVKTFDQAKAWIEYWKNMKGVGYKDFMATEFLPGKEFAFQSIWRDGELITSMARQRLEYLYGHLSLSGQTSTPSVAVTVHRRDVNEIATRAVLAVDKKATGIFCVDMKENKDGIPCVLEINVGRFFTTSNFFSRAGSNMPYYYVKMAFEEKLPKLEAYNPIPDNWYWVRMTDMGFKLVKKGKWTSRKV